MKLKIILISLFFILFSLSAYAGICFPNSQIYINLKTKDEKYLPCSNLLNRFLLPIETTSFVKSGLSFDLGEQTCGGKDISNLQKLNFKDFSTIDKIKIIINLLIFIIYILLPLILFMIIYRRLKSLATIIILDIIVLFAYIAWVFYLIFLFSSCT